MNIKVVFENKIHKLPSSVNTFNQIIENIRLLFPNKLRKNFEIYTQALPKQTPFRINDEDHFNELKQLYGHMKLKFIIKKSYEDSLEQEEIQALNQSILIQYKDSDQQLQEGYKNFEIINKKSNEQNQQCNMEQLVNQLVDERLEYHGLLQTKTQPLFKMVIEYSLQKINVIPGKQFLWSVCLRNISNVKWLKKDVYLMCIQGEYLNQKLFFNVDIPINELCTIGTKLIAPKVVDNTPQIFQLFHKSQHFGKQIIFKLQSTESLEKQKQDLQIKLVIMLSKLKLQFYKEFLQRLYEIRG
ncbi:unnamed protein product (macronuclear) [Paramecium tetraurelia]|uniref:MSP domain-containing protein n=1 Tax=Paramecium tetraurelia TaxID=5888 RepID=A0D6F0_PARTE|nr:uncharacterized protein GSPATT00001658001 [Paramecium tetraurelia]CAK78617.1 unnamed protein product [Paramecium tetraurelia]|eukprot:XP_001446014.1 hypothetical protein (macronuclear) [Paramecium tetraurelia strain d4-2]